MLKAALAYSALGLPVVPIHAAAGGKCSCGEGSACKSPGKHPLTAHGFRDATCDPTVIRGWFTEWPDANVAVAPNGRVVVVDVDRHGT